MRGKSLSSSTKESFPIALAVGSENVADTLRFSTTGVAICRARLASRNAKEQPPPENQNGFRCFFPVSYEFYFKLIEIENKTLFCIRVLARDCAMKIDKL